MALKRQFRGHLGSKKAKISKNFYITQIVLKLPFIWYVTCHISENVFKMPFLGFWGGAFGLKKGQNFQKRLHYWNRLKITFHLICRKLYIWKCLKTAIFGFLGVFGLKKARISKNIYITEIVIKLPFIWYVTCHISQNVLKLPYFGFWGPFGLKKGQNFQKRLHYWNRLKITFHLICHIPYIWKCFKTAIFGGFLIFFFRKNHFFEKSKKMLLPTHESVLNPKFDVVILKTATCTLWTHIQTD